MCTGQSAESNNHKRDIYITLLSSKARGPSWEERWKDCKAQRLRKTEAKQSFLDMAGPLHPQQLMLPAEYQASQHYSMEQGDNDVPTLTEEVVAAASSWRAGESVFFGDMIPGRLILFQ